MKLALLLVLVAACQADGGGDDYPIGPGGATPGNSSGRGRDGGISDGGGDGGVPQIRGRVCVLSDLRQAGDLTACATTGALGLNVTFGSARTTTTAADGSFSIDARMESNLVWRADSGNTDRIIPSVFPSGNGATIPAMSLVAYTELLSSNSVVLQDQQGSIAVQVRTGATRTADVTATSTGISENVVRYDGTSRVDWDELSTGAAGIVWFPGVQLAVQPPTIARISFFLNGTPTNQTVDAPVENQAITFMVKNLQ
jgi:hypothetical protein